MSRRPRIGAAPHVHAPACISCNQRRPGFLFEICALEAGDPDFTDALGRVFVCVECVKDPISQRTIVSYLVEGCAT